MTIDIDRLVQNLDPKRTVLFFGAGSSIPSGSPSAQDLKWTIAKRFDIEHEGFSLAEVAELAELSTGRKELVSFLRSQFPSPNPTGGLLNIPLYPWRGIYTTNYDGLIERAYQIRKKECSIITNNYDYSKSSSPTAQPIYKIHGTIENDICEGHQSRIVITQSDYDRVFDYREYLYDRLASDMAGADVVIVGYSLGDPEIKITIDRALSIQARMSGAGGQIYVILFKKDENRARLMEARGVRVSFGGIDQFSEALSRKGPEATPVYSTANDPVQSSEKLSATTTDIRHAMKAFKPNASAMFNGWPATYADIYNGLTFNRTLSNTITEAIKLNKLHYAVIVGASGVGKTTAARQICLNFETDGFFCWQHKTDFELQVKDWVEASEKLSSEEKYGILFIDDAHIHLPAINKLIDELNSKELYNLKLIMTSRRAQWQYRTKSPYLTKNGKEFVLSKLNGQEIDRLITLVSSDSQVKPLVESTFNGFSFQEKRRRLTNRCEADAFVCLRNIFAQEKFDDIILREYADLQDHDREIYRLVAALQNAGIRVHRQLILRLTGISAGNVSTVLNNLIDVISEYDISDRFGVFGWKVRHSVIASIISKYKYADQSSLLALFENVIKNISPTYEIERHSINEMCNIDTGIPCISDKSVQNQLFRSLISVAPGEPVPRHRLIRNLIELEKYDLAETEIRVFKHDIGLDGPVARYEIQLVLSRAIHTQGLLDEDRIVILRQAETKAAAMAAKFGNNAKVLSAYGDVGVSDASAPR